LIETHAPRLTKLTQPVLRLVRQRTGMLRTVERDCTMHESHRNKHNNTWVTKPLQEMKSVEGSQFVDIANS